MNSSELRFIVDVGVGKGIEKYLREEGRRLPAKVLKASAG
jgi:hypothetical protein